MQRGRAPRSNKSKERVRQKQKKTEGKERRVWVMKRMELEGNGGLEGEVGMDALIITTI